MSRSPAKQGLDWCEISILAMLGGLVVLGFAANGLSLLQSVVSLGFGAGVFDAMTTCLETVSGLGFTNRHRPHRCRTLDEL
jgi:hypothetical protein